MDLNAFQKYVELDPELITKTSENPANELKKLAALLEEALGDLRRHMQEKNEAALKLPEELEAQKKLLGKLHAILAKAENDRREDLKAVTQKRLRLEKKKALALEEELAQLDQNDMALEALHQSLFEKHAEIEGYLEALREPALPQASTSPPSAAPAEAPAPAPAPAQEAASGGKDDLDDAFAALFDELDIDFQVDEAPLTSGALDGDGDDDGIPELIEISPDELPEGEELPPEPKAIPGKPQKSAASKPAAPGKALPSAMAPKANSELSSKSSKDKATPKKKGRLLPGLVTLLLLGGGAYAAHLFWGPFF